MEEPRLGVEHVFRLADGDRHVDDRTVTTPMCPAGADVPSRLDALARDERAALAQEAAPLGIDSVTGLTTTLLVSAADDRAVAAGRALARHCLGALADVIEPERSGLVVRPRLGRIEVEGDYVEGDDLVAALTLLTGCVTTLLMGSPGPATGSPRLSATRGKFGWYAEDPGRGDLRMVWAWARNGARACGLDPTPVDDLLDDGRRTTADGFVPSPRRQRRTAPTG